MSRSTDQALIVFAKPPVPGEVKTRLTELLSEEEAARLYEAFLLDALDLYRQLGVPVRLYLTSLDISLSLEDGPVTLLRQEGEGLGDRMKYAFAETLGAGYDRAVIVGTDHPSLPLTFVEQAFRELGEKPSICIGPSEDGGYYLLGMNAFYPSVFEDITYSRPDVFEVTLDKIRTTPAELTVLPEWYDVDTPAHLRRLVAELVEGEVPARRARRTHRILERLAEHYPQL